MSLVRKLNSHLELILTFVGIPVIFLMPLIFGHDYWQVIGITAIGVGVVHGLLFWIIRSRQRKMRREAIAAIRDMLTDRIKNQLQIVLFAATDEQAESRERVATAMQAAQEISRTLDQLSTESLRSWERHYRNWTPVSAT